MSHPSDLVWSPLISSGLVKHVQSTCNPLPAGVPAGAPRSWWSGCGPYQCHPCKIHFGSILLEVSYSCSLHHRLLTSDCPSCSHTYRYSLRPTLLTIPPFPSAVHLIWPAFLPLPSTMETQWVTNVSVGYDSSSVPSSCPPFFAITSTTSLVSSALDLHRPWSCTFCTLWDKQITNRFYVHACLMPPSLPPTSPTSLSLSLSHSLHVFPCSCALLSRLPWCRSLLIPAHVTPAPWRGSLTDAQWPRSTLQQSRGHM